MLVLPISKGVSHDLRRVLEYRLRTRIELGQFQESHQWVVVLSLNQFGKDMTREIASCLNGEVIKDEEVIGNIPLKSFGKTIELYWKMLYLALCGILMEVFVQALHARTKACENENTPKIALAFLETFCHLTSNRKSIQRLNITF